MNYKIKNNLHFFVLLLIILINLVFILNFNKGIELTDESFRILSILHSNNIIGRFSNFGFVGEIFFNLINDNLFFYRIAGFILLLFSSTIACISFNIFSNHQSKNLFDNYSLIFLTALSGSFLFYKFWLITPAHDMYNVIGALLFFSGLCFQVKKNIYLIDSLSFFLIGIGILLTFINKPSTSIILFGLFFVYNFFFHRVKFFQNIIKFLIVLILFFAIYIYFSYGNFRNFFYELYIGYNFRVTWDPRYNPLTLFIFSAKVILRSVIDYWFIFLLQIFFCFFQKKNKYLEIILFLFPLLFSFFDNFNLIIASLFINILFWKNGFKLKNFFILIFILIIVFFITFGTNTNVTKHLQYSSTFYLIITYYLLNFFSFIKIDKNIYFILLILISILNNLYSNFYKPQRYDEVIFNQKFQIEIPNINGKIYVDEFTIDYSNKLNSIISKLPSNKNIKYLIDYTGRNPSLNLLSGYPFIGRAWWTSGYIGSNDYAQKILKLSKKQKILNSIVVIEKNPNNRKLSLDNFNSIGINFYEYFEFFDILSVKSNYSNRLYNFEFWIPK